MSTFKGRLYDICNEVASEFQNWNFVSGAFKNESLKHTTLNINPSFSFVHNSTPLTPAVIINHKRSMAIFKKLNGYVLSTSIVQFQNIAQLLKHMPDELRLGARIVDDKSLWMTQAKPSEQVEKRWIDITEARSLLRSVMLDGIEIIDKLYDLSSEQNFLRNLPPKYNTRHINIPYDEFEMQKGVMVCIVHALFGDFDFVEKYRSDDYHTIFPKRTKELDNVVAALPDLKKLYARV
jgi:hypothetical protein